jgi:hypothetical protein
MHGSVINVPTNVNQIQSILPCSPHDGATIGMFFKKCLEYKSLYMLEDVRPNMVMVVLRDLIKTPLYKYLNVSIHHQWASLFDLYMNLESQIPTYNNASFDNFDSDNENIYFTPIVSMMHKFLDVPKIMDYENTIYFIAPNQNFHPLSLFKDKHSKELNFPTLFYGQPDNFLKVFHINK